nr:hypothetical protein [Tanacetum cinerariifolium]
MSTLEFAEVHNLVVFLSKPTKSEGFEKTVDFLNANPIKIYVTPSHTKKIFRNVKRVGKGFSGREKSLFLTMMVQAQEDMGEDEVVNEEMNDSLKMVATTATSLDAEQDRETTKTTQALEINSLKRRVKKLEKRKRSRTQGLKRLYKVGLSTRVESFEDKGLGEKDVSKQGRITNIDTNEDIYLVNVHNDEDMFGVNNLDSDEVIVESVDVVDQAKEVVDITLAKALMDIKSIKHKANKVVIQEPKKGTTTTTPTIITSASSRPKAKGLVIHEQEQAPTLIVSSQQPL